MNLLKKVIERLNEDTLYKPASFLSNREVQAVIEILQEELDQMREEIHANRRIR